MVSHKSAMTNLNPDTMTKQEYYVIFFFSFAGSKLLNHVLEMCSKQNMCEIYLHVQTNNEDAIKFYKKFGFKITDTIQNYYINIEPRDCYVVTKSFAQSEASN